MGEESEQQQTEKCPNVTLYTDSGALVAWWVTDHRTEVVLYSPCVSNTPLEMLVMWKRNPKWHMWGELTSAKAV